jgi:type II secretory pathway pseudopilin PulG
MLSHYSFRHHDRGDTIIEVLFAITVFSLLAVGSIAIMNQGTAAAQRSLELTLVRQQIDSQAEALRYIQTSYVTAYAGSGTYDPASPAAEWKKLVDRATESDATPFGTCTVPAGAFVINTQTVKIDDTHFSPADTYARVTYKPSLAEIDKAGGIWVEGIKSRFFNDPTKAPYIDFHIRACWDGPGLNVPMTTGTIVRLYEPVK